MTCINSPKFRFGVHEVPHTLDVRANVSKRLDQRLFSGRESVPQGGTIVRQIPGGEFLHLRLGATQNFLSVHCSRILTPGRAGARVRVVVA